jgi:MORN repeat variant
VGLWLAASAHPHTWFVSDDAVPVRVEDSELDYGPDLVFTFQGQVFTGVAFEDVPGKWYCEVSYRDGMRGGPAREWYSSGVLKSESHYRENAGHGTSREWDESGRLISEETYEYAILVSRKKMDASGRVTESFEISPEHQHYTRLERYRQVKRWPAGT